MDKLEIIDSPALVRREPRNYYVYRNWRVRPIKARIHLGSCSFCNWGKGTGRGTPGRNGKWHGPFEMFGQAYQFAAATGGEVSTCGHCAPR